MKKLTMFLDWKTKHHWNVTITESNTQIQVNPNENPKTILRAGKDDIKSGNIRKHE